MPVLTARRDLIAADTMAAYATHLGIPVHDIKADVDYPMWNGTALKRPDGGEDWAHEISHWLLATPERRRLVNYGWGQDFQFPGWWPDDPGSPRRRRLLAPLPWPTAEQAPDTQEELDACVLTCAFLARLGVAGPWDLYGFYEYHGDAHQQTHRRLAADTYRTRRDVQPYVDTFAAWLRTLPLTCWPRFSRRKGLFPHPGML